MNNFIYVNKKIFLGKDYIPSALIKASSEYKDGIMLDKLTYEQWLKLKKDVLATKGYNIDLESGYRSYDYQAKVLAELTADKGEAYALMAVALPGHSEHQTGLALDYCLFKDGKFLIDHEFENFEEANYIATIAHQYGFIIRYPKGKERITGYQWEPWHLRYVGVNLATYLYENNLTLDEHYTNEKKGNEKH